MERSFTIFKYGIYSLLAFNIYLFFRHATFHEGMDCIGWLLLLGLFEWETTHKTSHDGKRPLFIAAQVVAYGLILYAWWNYLQHGQWIDLINATLWLGVVATIEFDMYLKRIWEHRQTLHRVLKVTLYASLFVIAIIWGATGEFLDFYDAALWIICFFAIEVNLLPQLLQRAKA